MSKQPTYSTNTKRIRFIQKYLTLALVVALSVIFLVLSTPNLVSATSGRGRPPTVIPDYAVFQGVINRERRMGLGTIARIRAVLENGSPTLTWQFGSPDGLLVPSDGSGATLRFRTRPPVTDLRTQLTIRGRRDGTGIATFSFPCTMRGAEAVIGWEGGRGSACTDPQGFRVTPGGRPRTVNLENLHPDVLARTKSLQAQGIDTSNPDVQFYCNALPSTGEGKRGISINGGSPQDACNQAIQQCVRQNSGSECSAVSVGEWSKRDPNLVLSLICERTQNRVLSDPTNGNRVQFSLQLLELASRRFGLLDTCLVDLYRSDTVVVAPATSENTVVLVNSLSDRVEVNAIRGDVLVRSAERPSGSQLRQGRKYIYYGDFRSPQGQAEERPINSQESATLQGSPVYRDFIQQSSILNPTPTVSLASFTLNSRYPTRQNGEILTYWGGDQLTGTLRLSAPAPAGGIEITVTSDHSYFTGLPRVIRIEAGQQEQTFNFSTLSDRGNFPAQANTVIRAVYGGTEFKRSVLVDTFG
jgi:hypothetical protein